MVKRYFVTQTADLEEDAEGDWVRASDYAAIESKLGEVQAAYDECYKDLTAETLRANDAESRLGECELRFQAARDAWDELAKWPDEGRRLAAHTKLLDAISGVRLMKPTPEEMKDIQRDLESAGVVERQSAKEPERKGDANDGQFV